MPEKSGGRHGGELEAAEALAALAHHIISSGKEVDDFGEDDCQRFRERFKKTNKSSTTPHERTEVLKKNTNTISSMVMHSEITENRMRHRAHVSGSCMKSRNQLTEAEREERRIRRVLANRESARQTIRRRQAMYEELTKNAAVLAIENENLKTKEEQAMTKYSSLKSMNECLKDLLDKASKAEAVRIQCGDPDVCRIKPSTSSPTPALFWPPFFNPADACQPQYTCQKCISIASPPVASLVSYADSEQGMHKSNEMAAPVYVLPFPWFFPLQMQCILQSSQPSIQYLQHDGHNQGYMNVLFGAGSSSQAEVQMQKCHASNAAKINSEIPHLTMSSCQDCGFCLAPDGTCKQSAEAMAFKATSYCGGASSAPLPSHPPEEDDSLVEMEDTSPSPSTWCLATKSEKPTTCSSKTSASAAAAAEARRKRKELTKLKTLCYRNHHMG
ncbi:hypothetical protein LIER_00658 [Lithospermum erythrorhizon]|uniref:BZIP domain-containing protein n=1 Tax=Lithospermum erythrorhizon TaxID=34254 RepID=A0AAV3NI56_LITER